MINFTFRAVYFRNICIFPRYFRCRCLSNIFTVFYFFLLFYFILFIILMNQSQQQLEKYALSLTVKYKIKQHHFKRHLEQHLISNIITNSQSVLSWIASFSLMLPLSLKHSNSLRNDIEVEMGLMPLKG